MLNEALVPVASEWGRDRVVLFFEDPGDRDSESLIRDIHKGLREALLKFGVSTVILLGVPRFALEADGEILLEGTVRAENNAIVYRGRFPSKRLELLKKAVELSMQRGRKQP